MDEGNYVTRVYTAPQEVPAQQWDALLNAQPEASPFMRHAYLLALHESGSACPATGWAPHFITLESAGRLVGACVVYTKTHSYGEYVFDWAWARAYQQHGLPYYPKALVAVPFTPVPGARLLAASPQARAALVRTLLRWSEQAGVSSLHLLFAAPADVAACAEAGLMLRHTVQFHWNNEAPTLVAAPTALPPEGATEAPTPFRDFEAFLASLTQDKRKKIRQERRKVQDAGVRFECLEGRAIGPADWDFFYRCYERTYLEHGNAPYLSRDFFQRMADTMPDHWVLFKALRHGRPIASSLIAVNALPTGAESPNGLEKSRVAYGRYWGALERVDCLHFEACYYQPLQWCIANGYQRFEGGAQGEHKMARALLPVKTTSAHWLAHPAFADAVARFLEREEQGLSDYVEALRQHSPFRHADS